MALTREFTGTELEPSTALLLRRLITEMYGE